MRKPSPASRPSKSAPSVMLVGAQDFVEPETVEVEPAGTHPVAVADDPDRAQSNGIDREQMVREAAYHRYEARGRVDGHALEDWLNAEADVEHLFSCG